MCCRQHYNIHNYYLGGVWLNKKVNKKVKSLTSDAAEGGGADGPICPFRFHFLHVGEVLACRHSDLLLPFYSLARFQIQESKLANMTTEHKNYTRKIRVIDY